MTAFQVFCPTFGRINTQSYVKYINMTCFYPKLHIKIKIQTYFVEKNKWNDIGSLWNSHKWEFNR